MSPQQLEINKFSSEGEVLRKIRCLAGRVTVFRSQNEAEIESYKKAFEGKPQQDRFSVLLDGATFYPQKHACIGFPTLDEAPPQHSVGTHLGKAGVDSNAVEGLLLQYGLGGLSQQSCSTLAPHEWKILRIVTACHAQAAEQVICMHEPFDQIPDKFRDPIADRIAKFAWEKQALIIITKLSYRPSVWIENDYIARVQLERPRQGTIGFGGGEAALSEHLATLRKEHGVVIDPAAQKPTGPDLLEAKIDRSALLLAQFNSPRAVGLTFSLIAILFGFGYYLWQTSAPLGSEGSVAVASNAQSHMGTTSNSSGSALGDGPSGGSANLATQPVQLLKKPVLEGYPEAVQVAWAAAIEHPETLLRPAKLPGEGDSKGANPLGEALLQESPIERLYQELSKK